MNLNYDNPLDIEKESFSIISREIEAMGVKLPAETESVIKRVVHTTADFDYIKNLKISPDAVKKAVEAIKAGADIVTDTNMAKAGISKKTLEKFGGEVFCYMSCDDVAKMSKEQKTTRAVASMEKSAEIFKGKKVIYAIGNAPTALLKLCDLLDKGLINPELIIGVPVGFVNVEESKIELTKRNVPYIAAMGRKGGSNVAAAICNALIYLASDRKI